MQTPTHHLLGAASGLAVAVTTGQPTHVAAVLAVVAAATGGGVLSPDVDQHKPWRLLDRLLPDELLGDGGPLRHRGISHWWGIPAAAAVLLRWQPVPVPAWLHLVAWGVVVGWASHLLGDLLVGAADPYAHRGPGIPVMPWWGHVGLGAKCGGPVEWAARLALTPTILWLAWTVTTTALHPAPVGAAP